MNRQEVMDSLGRCNSLLTGTHVVYTSWKHGSQYFDKDSVTPHTHEAAELCFNIAMEFTGVEAVVGPEKGGIILAELVAHTLWDRAGRDVLAFYAEKEMVLVKENEIDQPIPVYLSVDTEVPAIHLQPGESLLKETGKFVIRRGGAAEFLPGKHVLVVDNVLTTGGTVKKVVQTVRAMGGIVIGVGVICNQGNVTPNDVGSVPKLVSLIDLATDIYDQSDCPLCAARVPIDTSVGKGKQFLERKVAGG